MDRKAISLRLGLATLQLQATAATAFCGSPLFQTGIRLTSETAQACTRRRPLSSRPVVRRDRGRWPTMDAGEGFDQLDGVNQIPGMPETIGIPPIYGFKSGNTSVSSSSSETDYAQQLLWPSFNPARGGVVGSDGNIDKKSGSFRSGIHAILPTGGSLSLGLSPSKPQSLPEYSLESEGVDSSSPTAAAAAAPAADPTASGLTTNGSGVIPRDHAASVAEEIAHKISEGSGNPDLLPPGAAESTSSPPPSSFRSAALKSVTDHVEIRERRAAAASSSRGPAGIDPTRVPNLWLAVAHSSSVKPAGVKKVVVDGVPIALWRSATGAVSAVSDVCIHRGASLARGWVANDRLVCPYHGFEFEGDGRLAHMPGAEPPARSPVARAAAAPKSSNTGAARSSTGSAPPCGGRKAPTYQVKEVGGWIYIFPDGGRPGSVEQYRDPLVIPEAVSPQFRAIGGSMDFKGGVDACVENMLDMLHISFVHSFGNMQEPTPFEVTYQQGFDDPGTDALATSQVTFRYHSGSKSFSKVVGKSTEVVVKNEFHLPYRAVIRVYFGNNSLKTIEATAVPRADGETTLHWKLYRNFAMTHPRDEGPINKAGDFLFGQMMDLTLKEDKEIIENIYPEYQRGFMNARYDKQMLQYRKAIAKFQAAAAERANTQVESSLQMELLNRISRSQRGLASNRQERAAILDLIERLENVQAANAANAGTEAAAGDSGGGPAKSADKLATAAATTAAAAKEATAAATAVDALIDVSPSGTAMSAHSVEGEWHLEYVSAAEEGVRGWDFADATDPEMIERTAGLKEAGGEARLFDWNERGRPLWADTSESVQIIDTKSRTLTNRAVYKGWSGFTTTVQLDAFIEPLKDEANRLLVGFHKAIVNVGGIKVTFPHLQRFSPTGWMETTYINEGIRIARGNKGSIFVLTRQPVSPMSSSGGLFDNSASGSVGDRQE